MVSLILLLLPLAFAADLPNIVIVLTDDQVTLKMVPWYKVGFSYWYCAMCLAKRARHFVFCDLISTFLFCILHLTFCILYFQFCILLFTFCIFHFAFCILHFAFCILYFQDVFLDGMMPLQKTKRLIGEHGTTFEVSTSIWSEQPTDGRYFKSNCVFFKKKKKLIVSSVSVLVLGKQGQQPNWTTKKSNPEISLSDPISYAYFRMHLWTRPSVAHPGISSVWQ